ncbi:MAG TPA: response regulator [Bacteroidetes bacterium]|nr:response regulator [Bacteroidota bacterium]
MNEEVAPQSENEHLKLLIVDDEKHVRDGLKELGTSLGFNVFAAEDGINGCDLFKKVEPNLVIMDIYMPRMNGLLAMKKMKEMNPDCPIVLITGFMHYEQLVNQRGIKPDGFILKPFHLKSIADVMLKMVEENLDAVN